MPIITFTDKDLKRGTVITPGWYRVRIDNVSEQLAASQKSTNYNIEGTVIASEQGDKAFAGVPIDWNFNSLAIGFAKGFFEAFTSTPVAAGSRYDFAATVNKELLVFIGNDTYQGRQVNRVPHQYKPAKAA